MFTPTANRHAGSGAAFAEASSGSRLPTHVAAREMGDDGFRGSPIYASVNAHRRLDLSRRDDLWCENQKYFFCIFMTEYLTNVIHNIITVLLLFRSLLYTIVELLYGDLPWRADCLAKTPRVKLAKSGSSHHNAAGTSSEPHRMRVMLQKVAFNDDPTALFDGAVSSTWPRAAPRAFAVVTAAVVSSTATVASSSSASGVSSAGASAATAAADVSSVSTAQVIFFLFCCRTEYYTKLMLL